MDCLLLIWLPITRTHLIKHTLHRNEINDELPNSKGQLHLYYCSEFRLMKHAFSRKSLEASAVSGQIRPLRPILVNAKKQLLCSILRRDGIAAFLNYVNSLMEFLAWLSTYIYLKWITILTTETFLKHCCKKNSPSCKEKNKSFILT